MPDPAARLDELLTEPELAEILKRKRPTLANWRSKGIGPPYLRAGGRLVLYRRAEVEAWLAGRTFAGRAAEIAQSATSRSESDGQERNIAA
jgi:predicted DNA-binding transcriptional regulator AlpA